MSTTTAPAAHEILADHISQDRLHRILLHRLADGTHLVQAIDRNGALVARCTASYADEKSARYTANYFWHAGQIAYVVRYDVMAGNLHQRLARGAR